MGFLHSDMRILSFPVVVLKAVILDPTVYLASILQDVERDEKYCQTISYGGG